MTAYAHTLPDAPPSRWQPLYTDDSAHPGHLEAVGAQAARFASTFHAADWARLAGLWHDQSNEN